MEFPELSLVPCHEMNLPMKRKQEMSVDLQVKDPLPLDWEQCLDLESGRMYYLNRKTQRKRWDWPLKEEKLDLELNISSSSSRSRSIEMDDDDEYYSNKSKSDGKNNSSMIALPCSNCHLLVIVSQSSPACPNCKYVHSLLLSNNNNPTTSTPKCLTLLN